MQKGLHLKALLLIQKHLTKEIILSILNEINILIIIIKNYEINKFININFKFKPNN